MAQRATTRKNLFGFGRKSAAQKGRESEWEANRQFVRERSERGRQAPQTKAAQKRAERAELRRERAAERAEVRKERAAEKREAAASRRADTLNRQFLKREGSKKASKAAASKADYEIRAEELESHFAKGGTLAEFLRKNPGLTKAGAQRLIDSYQKGRGNPAKKHEGATSYRVVFTVIDADKQRTEQFFGPFAERSDAVSELKRQIAHFRTTGKRGFHPGWRVTGRIESFRDQGKRNPAAEAQAGYEEFHGHPSTETVTVSKKVHFHSHLSGAGELRGLSVKPIGHGLPVRTIGGLKKAILAFNENKNQLFIEGGDQYLSDAELRSFGIRKPHEIETLGKVTALDYFTSKSHLGSEGGTAVYSHRLRTTNENGQHVTVVIARYPDLIYRVVDQQLEFSGGSYEIRAEGIDK